MNGFQIIELENIIRSALEECLCSMSDEQVFNAFFKYDSIDELRQAA